MSAAADTAIAAPHAEVRSAGRFLNAAIVAVLCAWVLVPIYLILVNAMSAPADVMGWPKRAWPGFDFGSLSFFVNYAGVAWALFNSAIVALLTMALAIGLGAPAGYALARFQFRGKESFRLLVLMTRAFPLPCSRCRSPSSTSAPGSTTRRSGWRSSTPRSLCPSPC